jgi:hypothetical protein
MPAASAGAAISPMSAKTEAHTTNQRHNDPQVLAKLVEQAIGFLEMRKVNQLKMPMPIPTA